METNRSRPSADEENKMDLLKKGAAPQLSSRPAESVFLAVILLFRQDLKGCVPPTDGSPEKQPEPTEDEAGGSVFSIFKKVRSCASCEMFARLAG